MTALFSMSMLTTQISADDTYYLESSYEGNFEVEYDGRGGPGRDFALWYPKQLERGRTYPVVVWANATFTNPSQYSRFLQTVASHGFIVMAGDSGRSGDGAQMTQGIDWLQDGMFKGALRNHIDLDRIGVKDDAATVCGARLHRKFSAILAEDETGGGGIAGMGAVDWPTGAGA